MEVVPMPLNNSDPWEERQRKAQQNQRQMEYEESKKEFVKKFVESSKEEQAEIIFDLLSGKANKNHFHRPLRIG
jgi:hypothetical protein